MATILIGTSSWTDKSLVECGRFYPAISMTPEERLRFYASQFPIVEIDSSYYGIPTVENAQRWIERTPDHFIFNIKAYRLFTRHQTPVVSLSKELRAALGTVSKKNVYEQDLPEEITHELWTQFREVLETLRAGRRLGAVHMQFAPWVAFHPESFDYIGHCRAMLAGFTIAVEFRNKTWFNSDSHTNRTLKFERDNGLVNVIVDAPSAIPNTIPSVWEVTSPDLSVVRLHGRNYGTWNKKGLKTSSHRFDYDYPEEELNQIAEGIKAVAPKTKSVHVLFNNLCGAPHNAEDFLVSDRGLKRVERMGTFAGRDRSAKNPLHNVQLNITGRLGSRTDRSVRTQRFARTARRSHRR